MRTWAIIDCTTLEGTTASVFGPAFVAHAAAWWFSVRSGRFHDYIRGEAK